MSRFGHFGPGIARFAIRSSVRDSLPATTFLSSRRSFDFRASAGVSVDGPFRSASIRLVANVAIRARRRQTCGAVDDNIGIVILHEI